MKKEDWKRVEWQSKRLLAIYYTSTLQFPLSTLQACLYEFGIRAHLVPRALQALSFLIPKLCACISGYINLYPVRRQSFPLVDLPALLFLAPKQNRELRPGEVTAPRSQRVPFENADMGRRELTAQRSIGTALMYGEEEIMKGVEEMSWSLGMKERDDG